jgi:exopolyphosphatase/guanosine-5'-triphosphate,3'-diphosphate pyrophosphatase
MSSLAGQVHAAAVDLGSNSFHMVLATWEDGTLRVVDRIRERVFLATGLEKHDRLHPDAVERAMASLARFRQRLEQVPDLRVRAVGTNTFRVTRDPVDFHAQAEAALGHRIEILAGAEEARLIYRGIRYDVGRQGEEILAFDIGGGSTEVVSGSEPMPAVAESLSLGSGVWTRRFFPEGRIRRKAMKDAILSAQRRVEPIRSYLPDPAAVSCFGSSGTALSLARILQRAGWAPEGRFSLEALERLRREVEDFDHLDEIELDGLSSGRRRTFLGGLALMVGIMRTLDMPTVHTTEGALREGLLLDLLGRLQGSEDLRTSTVAHMQRRYRVDLDQAARVGTTAAQMAEACHEAWKLGDEDRHHLAWAAALHQIGLFVRHQGYHRHGAWLVATADLPGFGTGEAARLGFMIRHQRNRFPGRGLEDFALVDRSGLERSTLILRLAVLLHRSRAMETPPLRFSAPDRHSLTITAPTGWWEERPLTRLGLESERETWAEHGFALDLVEDPA